jgi:glycosyltransferase involved in cell wall biosynthesis
MPILIDGRPIRIPISGVARYCISLVNALTELHQSGALSDLPAFHVLVQDEDGTNKTLTELGPDVKQTNLNAFGRRRKTQNVVTEFLPELAARTVLRRYELIHETYFANLGSPRVHRKVSTIHDVIPLDYPMYFNRNNRFFSKRNFRRQASKSHALIADSHYTKKRILELSDYPDDQIFVVGCGVDARDAEASKFAVWPIRGVAEHDAFGLYIGNLEPRKNVRRLIEAWSQLGPSHDHVKLVIAGKLNYQGEATIAYGRELLGNRFVYVGPVSEAEKWALLKTARTLLLPSLYEGYGIPIIEAYSVGTLALFGRNSSMTELAHDPRQMFDAESPLEMGNTIAAALEDPAWVAEVRNRATEWVRDHTWTRTAHETAAVYRHVLGR